MELFQANIYEYLDRNIDPVFNHISQLKKGQSIDFKHMKITLNNFGLYEVETEESHNQFRGVMNCYYFVCNLIEKMDRTVCQ